MDTNKLFDLAEKLDADIAYYEENANSFEERYMISDLKAYREYVQEAIEEWISAMEIAREIGE